MPPKYQFKKDRFKKSRGKYSRLLNIYCRKCKGLILLYQKDGSGNLRRLYLDRIFDPKNLVNLDKKGLNQINSLKCKKCRRIIGTPYIYKKEKRKSFRLYQDAVINKVRKLN